MYAGLAVTASRTPGGEERKDQRVGDEPEPVVLTDF